MGLKRDSENLAPENRASKKAKKAKPARKARSPPPDATVSAFFNELSLERGSTMPSIYRGGDIRGGGSFQALTTEEMDSVAFPAGVITLQGDGITAPSTKTCRFVARNAHSFSVKELCTALAEFEGEEDEYGEHTFFEGLSPVGENTFAPHWGS